MRRSALFGAVLVLAMALGANNANAADVYKIGFMNSLSGYLAGVGTAGRDGFMLAIDEMNRAGGVNGRQLEVFSENDESDTAKGVPAAIRLINTHKVLAFVGPARSDVTEALGPIFEKNQIVDMTLSVLVPTQHGYTFAGFPAVVDEARLMINFLKKQGAKTIAILNAIDLYDKTLANDLADEAQKAGIKVVATESYNAVTDRNFIPQLSKFKVANAEWMLIAGSLTGLIMKQRNEIGYTGKVLGNITYIGQGMESLLQVAGPTVEGSYFTALQSTVWDTLPKDDPRYKVTIQFREQFKKKYGRYPEPEKIAYAQGYDLAMILGEAIKRAGADATGPKVKAAIEGIKQHLGANGSYTFTATAHASNSGLVIARVTKGSVALVNE